MTKIKNSLLSKVSAIVLVLALTIGTIPTSIISAQAAADAYGTVESISEVGGTIDSTDASNIIVKYEGVSIKHVEKDDSIDRTSSGWYVGAIMNVPDGIDFTYSEYTNADGAKTSLADASNADSIYMWKKIDETAFETEKAAGNGLEYTWEFDWDTTTEGTQKVVFAIDTTTVALSEEDTVKPVVETIAANPSEWTKDAVVISGTVSDNFSGVKSVSYKQEGTEEVKEATLTENSFSFTVDATVYEGKYIVWCTDNKDNESDQKEVSVYMDNVAPTVTAEANVTDWTKEAVTISGTVKDEHSGVASVAWERADGEASGNATYNEEDNTYTFTVDPQDYEGKYIVTCIDKAGNVSDEVTVEVKMDKTAPTATLQIETVETDSDAKKTIWEKIVDFVTFGIFTNKDEKMIITATDNLSGIETIHGYELDVKGGETKAEIQEKLLNVVEEDWTELYTSTEEQTNANDVEGPVLKDNKNIIYCVRVADYAGNEHYVTSNGMIFDIQKSTPVLTDNKLVIPKTAPTHMAADGLTPQFGIADTKEVEGKICFDVAVTEGNIGEVLQSGIKKVSYVLKNGDSKEAVLNDVTPVENDANVLCQWAEGEALITEYVGTIDVDAAENNYNYVELTVIVEDNAGNKYDEAYTFAIDVTAPTITGQATPDDWTNQKVVVSCVAEDTPSGVKSVTWEKADGSASGEAVFNEENNTYDFTIEAENYKGNYTITCTDYAGNETKINVAVQMDKDAPTATLQIETVETDPEPKKDIWVEIINFVTFGIFTNKDEKMIITATDNLSGIETIHGYELDVKGGETKAEIQEKLLNVVEEDWTELYTSTEEQTNANDVEGPVLKDNKNIIYCVRVADYAGNEHYVTSNGMIFDITDPAGGFDDQNAMLLPQQLPMNGEEVVYVPNDNEEVKKPLYGKAAVGEDGVVTFDVNIKEETFDGVLQSGINKVSYKVEAKDRNGFDKDGNEYQYVITQGAKHEEATVVNGGLLCQWTESEALITEYVGTIDVVAADNNHNYVRVTVTVEDNAGNIVSETYEFAIDRIAPKVKIEYNAIEPVATDGERGYFNYQRIARITYTERSENWNAKEAEKGMITALDINDYKVDGSYTISEWTTVEGETSDEDSHFAIVSFNPTNILDIKDEVIDGDEIVDSDEPEDTIQPVEPATGKDARYELNLSYTDAAGNSVALDENDEFDKSDVTVVEGTVHPFKFVIDTVSPEVTRIDYNEKIKDTIINTLTFNYFGANAQVTVTLNDETAGIRNFDYEGLLDSGISAKNKAVIKTAVEGAEIVQQQEDKSVFVVKFTIPKEALTELNSFRGTVRVNAWDYSNNTVQKHDETRLVVDKIAPTCQVTFDQPVKDVSGVSYYDKAFTATIVIDEANFYAEDVVINVNGQRVMPTDWAQTPGADIWTSHVTFTTENDYILTVNYTDRSGNVMTAYESNQRTLDTTEPVINVSNIKHESANNQETIGFTLTVTDKNMSLENVQPNVTAVVRRGESSANYTYERVKIDLGQPVVSTNDKGETVYTYTVTNLEIDGYYSLECTVVDHANHTVSNIGSVGANDNNVAVDVVNFSVNRGGSVFWIETEHNDKYSDKTFNNELNGAYANDKVTVKLHEVNVDLVDELEEEDKRTILTLNDGSDSKAVELVEKNNGTGNYDRNVAVGVGGWYETIYTLDNDQFAKDGTYSLNIITYDKAENSNVNTKNEEGTIKFVVDRTNPVVATNVKSGQIIDAEKYTVEFTIAEVNLDEKTIVVKLEGKEQVYEKVSSNTFKFEVENLLNDEFTIEVKDLAGNSAGEFKIDDLTVSTKWYVRWYANKPLFWGTIGGALVLSGAVIFFVVPKKRKKGVEA